MKVPDSIWNLPLKIASSCDCGVEFVRNRKGCGIPYIRNGNITVSRKNITLYDMNSETLFDSLLTFTT